MKKNDDIPQEIKVQVGGMARSGSTLLYNIMKLLLKEEMALGDIEWILDKEHKRLPGQDFYIVTMRDLRDTTASYFLKRTPPRGPRPRRTSAWSESIEALKRNMRWVNEFFHLNGVDFDAKNIHLWKYEEYKKDPLKEIKKIADFIGLQHLTSSTIEEVIKIAENLVNASPPHSDSEKLSPEEQLFLKETRLSKDHITANKGRTGHFYEFLSGKEIKQIKDISRDFLIEHGYMEGEIK